jgi:hypothetical protein
MLEIVNTDATLEGGGMAAPSCSANVKEHKTYQVRTIEQLETYRDLVVISVLLGTLL